MKQPFLLSTSNKKLLMRFFLSSLLLVLLFSCTTEDGPFNSDADLEGEWTLTNVSCFCFFEEGTDFSKVKIVFDIDENRLKVSNTGDVDYFRSVGTYKYVSIDNQIRFSDDAIYIFSINGSVLTLSNLDDPQIADDEVSYSFER